MSPMATAPRSSATAPATRDLSAQGYVVLRFTWRRLREEPLLVAARLAQVLARRGR